MLYVAGTRAHNHFKDFALGTSADTSLEEDEVPNVLVIHSHKVHLVFWASRLWFPLSELWFRPFAHCAPQET